MTLFVVLALLVLFAALAATHGVDSRKSGPWFPGISDADATRVRPSAR